MQDAPSRGRPQLLVLVGPKGSGKTTIGRMLDTKLGLYFLPVEEIALQVLAERGGRVDEQYAKAAFDAILVALERVFAETRRVVIEATGASDESAAYFAELQARYDTRFVRILAGRATCEQRLRTRDAGGHVAISPELAARMHERSERLELPWALTVDNESSLSPSTLLAAVERLLHSADRRS